MKVPVFQFQLKFGSDKAQCTTCTSHKNHLNMINIYQNNFVTKAVDKTYTNGFFASCRQ
jgi:hypothetical protein